MRGQRASAPASGSPATTSERTAAKSFFARASSAWSATASSAWSSGMPEPTRVASCRVDSATSATGSRVVPPAPACPAVAATGSTSVGKSPSARNRSRAWRAVPASSVPCRSLPRPSTAS